jgi:hypothetical protein
LELKSGYSQPLAGSAQSLQSRLFFRSRGHVYQC